MTRVLSDLAVEAPGPLEPGAMVDDFRVERVLAVGAGGATIVQALTPQGERVALKLLGPAPPDPEQRRRFLSLVKVRAAIEHPNLVPLLGAGEHQGRFYLVSELPSARMLADRLRDGVLGPAEAIRVGAGVAMALDAAAEEGLLHAELSPQTILLARDRPTHALLTDFGIGRTPARPQNLRMTVEDADYRSPEEVRGEPLQPESNSYSLACILYECLTGTPPYPFERPLLTLHAHLVEPPPRISALRPDLPSALDEVFACALAKPPAQRLGAVSLVRAAAGALAVPVAITSAAEAREAEQSNGRGVGRPSLPVAPPSRAAVEAPTPAQPEHEAPKRAKPERAAPRHEAPKPQVERPAPEHKSPKRAKPQRAAPRHERPKAPVVEFPVLARPAAKRPAAGARRDHAGPRRIGRLGPRSTIAIGAVALVASGIAGFTLGSSGAADEPAPAPKEKPQVAKAELEEAAYVRAVGPVIDRLSERRAAARRRLRRAPLPGSQADAARSLVKAYVDARRGISADPPASLEGLELREQLLSAERAYRRLAAAARSENERAWRSASRDAVQHERRFERSLRSLTTA